MRTSLHRWSASLLATLGVLPVAGCSSSSGPDGAMDRPTKAADGGFVDTGLADTGATGDAPTTRAKFLCNAPVPLVQGADTGFDVCDTGFVHRSSVHACPSALPRSTACGGLRVDAGVDAGNVGCSADTDCTAHPDGMCSASDPLVGVPGAGCSCYYGCQSDSDCGAGKICLCGSPVGVCVSSSCSTDADCGAGSLCTMSTATGTCPSGVPFACQTPQDTCGGDQDCMGEAGRSKACGYVGAVHQCVDECIFGRPFLVHGAAQVAGVAPRRDWKAVTRTPDLAGLSAPQREAVGVAWTRMAGMEHASIAAFARFALQLLSIGAPASLIEQTNDAMRDETEHAKMCFALASAYLGRDVGPGALRVGDALAELSPEAILTTTIVEGCIGETVAAVEAAEALEHARDPEVRRVLSKIAEDEKRHAELAWRFVQWAMSRDATLRATAVSALTSSLATGVAAVAVPRSDRGMDLLAFGVVPDSLREEIRARVVREIIAPCAKALLEAPAEDGRGQPLDSCASV
jgi:hypothetical protein